MRPASTTRVQRKFRSLPVFNERFRPKRGLPCRDYADPIVHSAVKNRIEDLTQRPTPLHSIEIYWVIVYKGWRAPAERFRIDSPLGSPPTYRVRLSRTLTEFSAHYHGERNHQGKENQLVFPSKTQMLMATS